MTFRLVILLALVLAAAAAFAAGTPKTTNQFTVPSTGTTAYSGATVGAAHGSVLAAGVVHVYLMLANPSAAGGATTYCAFGATATVNGAGTVPIAPGQIITWEGSYAPLDAIDCIATAGSTPLTIGVQ